VCVRETNGVAIPFLEDKISKVDGSSTPVDANSDVYIEVKQR
jgi:hypothetical protein